MSTENLGKVAKMSQLVVGGPPPPELEPGDGGDDSCVYATDGSCDEPEDYEEGTGATDCGASAVAPLLPQPVAGCRAAITTACSRP